MCSANEIFPELKDLPPLPIHEMALRLCFLYDDHNKHPEHEDIPECVLTLSDISKRCQALHANKMHSAVAGATPDRVLVVKAELSNLTLVPLKACQSMIAI